MTNPNNIFHTVLLIVALITYRIVRTLAPDLTVVVILIIGYCLFKLINYIIKKEF